jgi:hypothetical protein
MVVTVLCNLYTSPIILKIKSRRKRWVGRAAYVGQMKNAPKNLARKPGGEKITWKT